MTAAPRPRPAPPRPVPAVWLARPLLDGPVELDLPGPPRGLYNRLHGGFWRLSPFRDSRLPAGQRLLEALVAFRYPDLKKWEAGLGSPPGPGPARPGPARLWLGKRDRWPEARGAFEQRRSLLLLPGSRAAMRTRLGKSPKLRFDLGVVPLRQGRSPVRLTVSARPVAGGPEQILLARAVGREAAGQWARVWLDLGALAGREVVLRFGVTATSPVRPLGAVALGQPVVEHRAADPHPNLIFLMLDTVRPDALGCYGQRRVATPQVDAIARRGVRFARAYTNSTWTRPSMMTLLSSRTPYLAGGEPGRFGVFQRVRRYLRESRIPTLYSHLAAQGYVVRGVVNNFFMPPHERVGIDHGLADFVHLQWGQSHKRLDNEFITRGVERFLAAHRDRRFFLYIIYESVHAPYSPPPEAQRAFRQAAGLGRKKRLNMHERYLAEVMSLDRYVGRIVAALKRHRLLANTLLAVTSDHGEVLERHHCYALPRMQYNTCYSHSASPYDQVLHVPLILAGPGIPTGRVTRQLYRHLDFAPTMLDLMRLPPLPGAQGVSVAAAVRGGRPGPDPPLYVAGRGEIWALRQGRYKLILRLGRARFLVRTTHWPVTRQQATEVEAELYDLERDPKERKNLVRRLPEVARRLRAALRRLMKQDRLPADPAPRRRQRRRSYRPPAPRGR